MLRRFLLAGLFVLAALAQPAAAAPFEARLALQPGIAAFYAARGSRPLWIAGGRARPEANALLSALAFAGRNGFDPARYHAAEIRSALRRGEGGDKAALARAELMLSDGFARYVADLHRGERVIEAERGLVPSSVAPRVLLDGAAAAPSLAGYLRAALAMNPLYETLRSAYGRTATRMKAPQRRIVERNLARLRAIPAEPARRWILVDAGGARLWMMEGRRVAGSMRVIVGKPRMQTPAMAARLRYAILNPYWNLPPDLVRERARRVLREGTRFLAGERLQLLSDWGPSARVIAPAAVDWRAVASGRRYLRMRQLPGGANVMGAVKYMMPNGLGIYLHDFPDKSLFRRDDRHLSSGCVRLEDAARLGQWLFGGRLPTPRSAVPEQIVDLPEPVPVYIVYLTAFPAADGIDFRRDVYGEDRGASPAQLVPQDPADRARR